MTRRSRALVAALPLSCVASPCMRSTSESTCASIGASRYRSYTRRRSRSLSLASHERSALLPAPRRFDLRRLLSSTSTVRGTARRPPSLPSSNRRSGRRPARMAPSTATTALV